MAKDTLEDLLFFLHVLGQKHSFDVFISHSWKGDSLPVSKVVKDLLEKDNFRVWYDEQEIQGDLNKVNIRSKGANVTILSVTAYRSTQLANGLVWGLV